VWVIYIPEKRIEYSGKIPAALYDYGHLTNIPEKDGKSLEETGFLHSGAAHGQQSGRMRSTAKINKICNRWLQFHLSFRANFRYFSATVVNHAIEPDKLVIKEGCLR
jgi:hypothetical protein